MVHAEGPVGHSHLHAAAVGQLLPVNLRLHAVLGSCFEDAGCLVGGEEALVAEHVDEIGQSLPSHLGNHFAHNQVHIVALPTRIGASHGVGTEESAAHGDRARLAYAPYHAQHLQLVLRVQTVTALDFYRARAFIYYLPNPTHGLTVELILRQLVQTVGRIQYAAAAPRYLRVAQPLDFVDKLLLAAVGIDQMGVAVAERRQHRSALGIDDVSRPDGRTVTVGAEILDFPVFNKQPCVLHRFHMSHFLAAEARFVGRQYASQHSDILDQCSFHDVALLMCHKITKTFINATLIRARKVVFY